MQPVTDQDVKNLADAIQSAASHRPSFLDYVPVVSAMIAALSAGIAAVTAFVSIRMTRSLAREARGNKLLPIIIFYRRAGGVWTLKNIGEGTASGVFIRNYIAADRVLNEVALYPVAPNQEIRLDYLEGADKLVARYVNIFGQDPHYTICARNDNDLKSGEYTADAGADFSKGHEGDVGKWKITRLS